MTQNNPFQRFFPNEQVPDCLKYSHLCAIEAAELRAFDQGKADALAGKELNSGSREGTLWDSFYRKGFKEGAANVA